MEAQEGVEKVLITNTTSILDHERAGDLLVIAEADAWFTYYYWMDNKKAPDFARTVDIHRKPGYDPVEMFTDPGKRLIFLRVMGKLLKRKLGFRTMMDIIPLEADLVKGSHGRIPEDILDFPIFISGNPDFVDSENIEATDVYELLYRQITSL